MTRAEPNWRHIIDPHTLIPPQISVWGCTTSDPKKLVMLMELIENGDLRDMLDNEELNKTLTIKMKIRILRDIAEAMKYLYEQNPPIEHRDLKVSSIGMYSERKQENSLLGGRSEARTMEAFTRLMTPPPYSRSADPKRAAHSRHEGESERLWIIQVRRHYEHRDGDEPRDLGGVQGDAAMERPGDTRGRHLSLYGEG